MLTLSLYIPCFNAEKHIAPCLEGVLGQTHAVDEILVIDDGSRDRTREIASEYPVRIVRHERNQGLAAARNTGLRAARNEWVAALDADCVPSPDWLERLVPHFGNGRLAAAGGRLVETVLESVADRWRRAHMAQDWGDACVTNPPFVCGNNSVIRKSVVAEVGWYDERLRTNAEDAELSWRIRAKGYDLVYDPSAIVHHLRHDSARSVMDAYWRYVCFGYFQKVTLKSVLQHICVSNLWTFFRHFGHDWQSRKWELLWLDALLPIYMSYRDLRMLLQRATGEAAPQIRER